MPPGKPDARPVVLITGTSSGIGLDCAVRLASRFRVFASMRDTASGCELQKRASEAGVSLDVLQLDVTSADSIQRAVAEIKQRCGALYGLVNNAGIQLRGYFEDLAEDEIRSVFETNVFGAMALTRAVLPAMRQAGKGRLVFVTSIGGRMGSPGLTSYCASKFAMEGFAESLSLEVAPLGIQTILIEPGIIKTAIWGSNRNIAVRASNPASPYYHWFRKSERLADWAVQSSPTTPEDVARAVERSLTDPGPRLRYLVGRRASLILTAKRMLPEALFDRLYSREILRRITAEGE